MDHEKLPLTACHDCDLLLREIALPAQGIANCPRCGAELYRSQTESVDRTLAYTLAATALFVIANAFPIARLDAHGQRSLSTLYGAVQALYEQNMWGVAALVFITTILVPTIELAALLYLLLPLRVGRMPAWSVLVFRTLQTVRPWGMIEVLLLGVIVSIAKLGRIAQVEIGVAIWAFAGLMMLLAAIAATFNPRDLWAKFP